MTLIGLWCLNGQRQKCLTSIFRVGIFRCTVEEQGSFSRPTTYSRGIEINPISAGACVVSGRRARLLLRPFLIGWRTASSRVSPRRRARIRGKFGVQFLGAGNEHKQMGSEAFVCMRSHLLNLGKRQ